jgi:hypothetical protein
MLRRLMTMMLIVRLEGLARGGGRMPEKVSKANLPSKICVVCDRPFTWRKKWERCWDEVTVCSKRCGAERRGAKRVVAVEGARDSADRDAEDNKRAAKLDRRLAKEERRARRTGQDG